MLEKNGADLKVQFQRIAMMQAEIDRLKVIETALPTQIEQLRKRRTTRRECEDAQPTAPTVSRRSTLESAKWDTSTTDVTDDATGERAYQLYEVRGREPGSDVEDWLCAERELRETNGTHNLPA